MITAIVLIHAQRQSVPQTAQALLEIDGVAEVYSVAGDYDLVAILRLRHFDEMAQIVTERMAAIPTITRTLTMPAFRCYSNQDLERMWAIGLEEPTPPPA